AYLIGVRQNDEAGFELLDELLNRQHVTVCCVVFQERVLNAIAFVQLLAGKLTAQRLEFVACDGRCQWLPGSFCHLLPGAQCLPGHAVVRSAAMLQQNQDSAHITRTSNFNFSTSFAAASLGEPSSSCVSFFFSGR